MSERARLHFMLGHTVIARTTVESQWEPCLAFFCPVCGEIWGRIISESDPTEWWSVSRECEAHSQPGVLGFRVPGSLFYALRHRWADMPDPVVVREGELMLKQCADYQP